MQIAIDRLSDLPGGEQDDEVCDLTKDQFALEGPGERKKI
jgi:hypothetical protein